MSISIIWLFSWAPLELYPGSLKSLFLIGGELAIRVVKSIGLVSSGSMSSANIEVFPSGYVFGSCSSWSSTRRVSSSCLAFSSSSLESASTMTPFFF